MTEELAVNIDSFVDGHSLYQRYPVPGEYHQPINQADTYLTDDFIGRKLSAAGAQSTPTIKLRTHICEIAIATVKDD